MRNNLTSTLLLAGAATTVFVTSGQSQAVPRFEQYRSRSQYVGKPKPPIIDTADERENRDVITNGVERGWGVFDGSTGREFTKPGPNFSGNYVLVNFGCGNSYSNCLGTAIVDAATGRIFGPPVPQSGVQWRPYFGMIIKSLMPHPPSSFHGFPFQSPIRYRLNSRLLIVNICEGLHMEEIGSVSIGVSDGCGDHYYLMEEDGLKFLYRNSTP
jgi:hypothetical protein